MNNTNNQNGASLDPIKEATFEALTSLLEPLVDLMLDTGITVQEFNQLMREKAVLVAAKRVMHGCGRANKSRVAIKTGLPRSEVTRILKAPEPIARTNAHQHPIRRLLAAWFDSPLFADQSGRPATLPIFGKKQSFQKLVEKFGGGIPIRAMLDELTQVNAIEQLPDQRVRPKARVPTFTGLSSDAINSAGERCKDLLNTLTRKMRDSESTLFVATAFIDDGDGERISNVRRELTEQGTIFIDRAAIFLNESRKRKAPKNSDASGGVRLGVTVFYFEDAVSGAVDEPKGIHSSIRRNLRRRKQKI